MNDKVFLRDFINLIGEFSLIFGLKPNNSKHFIEGTGPLRWINISCGTTCLAFVTVFWDPKTNYGQK